MRVSIHILAETLIGHAVLFDSTQRAGKVYLFTYLLSAWSRVLLEKITVSVASQEIPRIFGTRKFITVGTSTRHMSLS